MDSAEEVLSVSNKKSEEGLKERSESSMDSRIPAPDFKPEPCNCKYYEEQLHEAEGMIYDLRNVIRTLVKQMR